MSSYLLGILNIFHYVLMVLKGHVYVRVRHRKRTKTVEKAKVVAAAWGTEFIQFIAVLAVLHQDDMK